MMTNSPKITSSHSNSTMNAGLLNAMRPSYEIIFYSIIYHRHFYKNLPLDRPISYKRLKEKFNKYFKSSYSFPRHWDVAFYSKLTTMVSRGKLIKVKDTKNVAFIIANEFLLKLESLRKKYLNDNELTSDVAENYGNPANLPKWLLEGLNELGSESYTHINNKKIYVSSSVSSVANHSMKASYNFRKYAKSCLESEDSNHENGNGQPITISNTEFQLQKPKASPFDENKVVSDEPDSEYQENEERVENSSLEDNKSSLNDENSSFCSTKKFKATTNSLRLSNNSSYSSSSMLPESKEESSQSMMKLSSACLQSSNHPDHLLHAIQMLNQRITELERRLKTHDFIHQSQVSSSSHPNAVQATLYEFEKKKLNERYKRKIQSFKNKLICFGSAFLPGKNSFLFK